MMRKMAPPRFKEGDYVVFRSNGEKKTGQIYIVDRYGTFGQNEEPSYDVMVDEENCLYKHIRDSHVAEAV